MTETQNDRNTERVTTSDRHFVTDKTPAMVCKHPNKLDAPQSVEWDACSFFSANIGSKVAKSKNLKKNGFCEKI
jgi:hypothetical protein